MNKLALLVAPLALATGLALAQTAKPAAQPSAMSAAKATDCPAVLKARVNINKAPLEEMKCLPGFVTSIAQDVIANRPFKDQKDFEVKIEVVGKKLWPKIAQYVVFK